MSVYQYAPQWTGATIGTGATVFNLMTVDTPAKANQAATLIRNWFEARKVALPDDITITFPSEMRVMDLDGTLTATQSVTPPANTFGTSALEWAGGTGRVVKWSTGVVVNGRRLIGHTYLVPSVGVYSVTGTILPATITADNTATATLVSQLAINGTPLVVWSRKWSVMYPVTVGITLPKVSRLKTRLDA